MLPAGSWLFTVGSRGTNVLRSVSARRPRELPARLESAFIVSIDLMATAYAVPEAYIVLLNSLFSRASSAELGVSKCSRGCKYCFRGRAEGTDRTRIDNNEDTTHRHPPPLRILEARKHYSPRIEKSTKSAEQPAGCGRDARMTSVGRGIVPKVSAHGSLALATLSDGPTGSG